MSLSKQQKNQYLLSGGEHCPYCGSDNIASGEFNTDGDSAWRTPDCVICGRVWREVYTMVDVEEV